MLLIYVLFIQSDITCVIVVGILIVYVY